MNIKNVDKFKAEEKTLNAMRIITDALLSGEPVKIGEFTYVAASTTDNTPFKVCIVAEEGTVLGTSMSFESLYTIANKLTEEELFLLSSSLALKNMVPEREIKSIPSTLENPNSVDISRNEKLKKIIQATRLDFEAIPKPHQQHKLIASLTDILKKEELNPLNISLLYPYLQRFQENPLKYDEMYENALVEFGKEKATNIVTDIKSEHEYLWEILSENFYMHLDKKSDSAIISKKENIVPENIQP